MILYHDSMTFMHVCVCFPPIFLIEQTYIQKPLAYQLMKETVLLYLC